MPEAGTLGDTEAVLFVDDNEADVLEEDVILEEGVGADEDVEAAGEEVGMEDVAVALAGGTGEEADGDGGVFQKGG